jgi:hypothetical protein
LHFLVRHGNARMFGKKYRLQQSQSESMSWAFPLLGVQVLLHWNLVLYETKGSMLEVLPMFIFETIL